ncbi:hypothetical protein, partial [Streptomyces sp. Tue6028]|uniref:hypothetical protein n=1 Tax=Streptomyces sp. Tue6028 TaxID=2036037 RepID=UPI003D759F11
MSTGKILSITALAAAALLTPVVANAADLSTAPAVAVVNHSLAKPATTSQHAMVVRAGQRVN